MQELYHPWMILLCGFLTKDAFGAGMDDAALPSVVSPNLWRQDATSTFTRIFAYTCWLLAAGRSHRYAGGKKAVRNQVFDNEKTLQIRTVI